MNLKKFYNDVYKKGDKKHYTKFRLNTIPLEYTEILTMMDWKGKSVLDVGCGSGDMCGLLHAQGAHTMGIDFSHTAIAEAMRKYPNLLFEEQDIDMVGGGELDVVMSLGTLEHVDDPLATLRRFKKMIKKGGDIIITCPNWKNPRGYILQTLQQLFDMPITLADRHYFTPRDFKIFSEKLKMDCSMTTVDRSWASGEKMISDLKRRLPNVFRDSEHKIKQEKIDRFITWLSLNPLTEPAGAVGVYHFHHAL